MLDVAVRSKYFVRALRCGSAILVAGAENREVARCGGGHISWQARGIVRLRIVVEVNVAVTSGLACERVLFGGAGIAKLLGRAGICTPMGLPA